MALNFDPDHDYTADERLRIALGDYHIQKQEHDNGQRKVPPNVAPLAHLYAVNGSTLHGHIKKTSRKTLSKLHSKQQLLSRKEESELLKQALFMDDCNIPRDRETHEQPALRQIRQRYPGQQRMANIGDTGSSSDISITVNLFLLSRYPQTGQMQTAGKSILISFKRLVSSV